MYYVFAHAANFFIWNIITVNTYIHYNSAVGYHLGRQSYSRSVTQSLSHSVAESVGHWVSWLLLDSCFVPTASVDTEKVHQQFVLICEMFSICIHLFFKHARVYAPCIVYVLLLMLTWLFVGWLFNLGGVHYSDLVSHAIALWWQ